LLNHVFDGLWKTKAPNSVVVTDRPPATMTGAEIRQQIDGLVANTEGSFVGYGEQHMWTHKSGLTRLPYYDDLLLPHNIDVMHTKKNVVEALWATIMDIHDKSNDNVKARVNLVALCDRGAGRRTRIWHPPYFAPVFKYIFLYVLICLLLIAGFWTNMVGSNG
jgi:hypothetical protein